ncbi:nucleotide sugar dehydrogenase, partial [Campylobacter insulaenigrae]|uniref:nucleotide sugar dehydrogenase n=1 Tax=Campylobacter insulaenigrae TaxID=260714 RepID=UPI002152FDCF
MRISVVGIGYVGLSNALLLSINNEVVIMDIDKKKVDLVNAKKSPIKDSMIEEYLNKKNVRIIATANKEFAFKDADYIIIATPTNYDEKNNFFNTSSIESVISDILNYNKKAIIIIKSTVPIGYTNKLRDMFGTDRIIFSPEFLREGKALYDILYPSRIIVGEKSERGKKIAEIFFNSCLSKDVQILLMDSCEAESVKLFSNAYLAMRIGFFNELDSYAKFNNLNTKDIISGVSADPRIGNYYNNPSFGYGGYC